MGGIIKKDDKGFPSNLLEIKNCPEQLYYEGNVELLRAPLIGVVGSRKCTAYGKTVAREIGRRLGESGIGVVSGMAKGIDTEAHMSTLNAGGKTIAVLGCGLDICYPSENRKLYEKIAENGLLISEYPYGFKAKPYTFPLRNRIISGISESIVIVEAGNRSGALITAELAAEQGKNLYAVPGNITSYYSFGTNKLIRENVTPLIMIDDLILDLGIKPNTYINEEFEAKMGEDEKIVYKVLKNSGEMTLDEICFSTKLSVSKISGLLTILEMKGVIFSEMGKFLVAKF